MFVELASDRYRQPCPLLVSIISSSLLIPRGSFLFFILSTLGSVNIAGSRDKSSETSGDGTLTLGPVCHPVVRGQWVSSSSGISIDGHGALNLESSAESSFGSFGGSAC